VAVFCHGGILPQNEYGKRFGLTYLPVGIIVACLLVGEEKNVCNPCKDGRYCWPEINRRYNQADIIRSGIGRNSPARLSSGQYQ